MKSAKAIRLYLSTAPWRNAYMLSAIKFSGQTTRHMRFFEGQAAEFTISGAFFWAETPEGWEYWKDIDRAFIDWFNRL